MSWEGRKTLRRYLQRVRFSSFSVFEVVVVTGRAVIFPLLQMTGRKGRVVSNDDGSITYESRSELDVPVEILNLTEKQRFMDGEKVNKNESLKV